MNVAIIGLGIVGSAQARMFSKYVHVTYDPQFNDSYPADAIENCDFAVISVGTPSNPDGSNNLNYVYQAFGLLPVAMPVLIRSTINPGTVADLQSLHPNALICHAPEFMHEREGGAWKESSHVPFLVLGGTPEARDFFRPKIQMVYPGRIHECSSLESELVKYTGNLYLAAKVTFVNEMANICKTYGVDWEKVRDGWIEDPRTTPAYTHYEGFPPGFGGRCWPKDLSALIASCEEAGYKPEFLQAIQDANRRFTS